MIVDPILSNFLNHRLSSVLDNAMDNADSTYSGSCDSGLPYSRTPNS